MIIYTFIIISFISSIPYAFSQITVNGPKDVLVGGNAKLVWVVKLDVKSFEQYLYNDTEKDGEDLWNSIDQNNINGLIGIFGKGRVKFEKIVEPGSLQLTFTLEIKDIKFNESFSFLLFVKDKTGKEMQKEGIINVYEKSVKPPTKIPPPDESDSSVGAIVGGVLAAVVIIIIIVIIAVFYCKKKKAGPRRKNSDNGGADATDFSYHKEPTGQYAPVGTGVADYENIDEPRNGSPPKKEKYSKLGPGGRTGPKDHVTRTQYAEVKTSDGNQEPPSNRHSNLSAEDNQVSDSIIV